MRELTEEDTDTGELLDLDEFIGECVIGDRDDYDGYGYLVYDETEVEDKKEWSPSMLVEDEVPEDATHILWFSE